MLIFSKLQIDCLITRWKDGCSGAFYFDSAVSDGANCHSEDRSSIVSSHFVEEVETLTVLPPSCTDVLTPSIVFLLTVTFSATHRLTSCLHTESGSGIWHWMIPNPSLCPVFSTLPFWFCFLNLLVTLCFPHLFFLVQWFLPCLSPVRFWPGETYSMLLSGLPVRDIWTLMTGKPMLLVLRVRTSFIFCHRQNIFNFSPILNGE